MKLARLVVYLALGFVIRSLYLFFFGSSGLVVYHSLESYRRQLEGNLRSLQEINAELMDEQRALGTDPERVALQARELGFFRQGEQVVRIEGYSPPRRSFTVGRLIRERTEAEGRDWIPQDWIAGDRVAGDQIAGDQIAKMLGLVVPLALFVAALVRDRRRRGAPQRR